MSPRLLILAALVLSLAAIRAQDNPRQRVVFPEDKKPLTSDLTGKLNALLAEPTSPERAATFAAALANQKTRERFDREPFSPKDGQAVQVDGRWTWHTRKGAGTGDIGATVSFATDGSARTVELSLQTSRFE